MVKFIVGRAGSGKTHRVLCEMRDADGELILLVPEQYSHTTERALCACAGDSISAKAEVLSFTRLCDRIFASAGGLANRVLDGGSRILLMHKALAAVKGSLRVLNTAASKPEFLENLISIVEELKTCCIAPESIMSIGEGHLSDKLYDIALIASAYNGEFKSGNLDPADKISLAVDAAKNARFFAGKKVWVDGYTGFTPQELELLRVIFAQSAECTVTMMLNDNPDGENGAFAKSWDTYSRLARMAGDSEIVRLDKNFKHTESLAHLDKNLFSANTDAKKCDGIEIYSASDAYDECKIAAAKIKELIRQGLRYRDIAVAARNYTEYDKILSSVFSRYDIPIYENSKQAVLSQAPVTFVISALNVIADGFRYDDMEAYLKTGLCGVRGKNLDRLEHYLYTWHTEGKKWTREEDFDENPSGRNEEFSESDKEELSFVNRMRARIRTPLMNLRANIRANPTGAGICEALVSFFEEIKLARRLSARAVYFRMKKDVERAEMYESLWQILISALQSVYEVHADTRFTITDFAKIFSLMLSQYEVGMIPTGLDRVHVGEFARLGEAPVKCLIVLGAIDGRLPMYSSETGILSDSEREQIEALGISLAKNPSKRLDDEFRLIYTAFTASSDRLILTVPAISADGSEARESFVVKKLRQIFSDLKIKEFEFPETYAESACFDIAAQKNYHPWRASARKYFADDVKYSERLIIAERNSSISRGPLRDKENIDALFGRKIRLSASRTDSFSSCRYQYFLRYGLKLMPRRRASFDALEVGTFVHEILEHTLKEINARGGHHKVPFDDVRDIADREIERFINEKLGGFAGRTARFAAQFKQLKRNVHAILKNIHEELLNSRFAPIEFELEFSNSGKGLPLLTVKGEDYEVTLNGFVDRVDACEDDGELYVRVVDYKTGKKAFDLKEVINGINMQLLLYLFALCDLGEERFGKKPTPAGVLYLSARDPIYLNNEAKSAEEVIAARNTAKKRSGLLLANPELFGENEFLPIKYKKDGTFDAKSSVATLSDFEKISKRITQILKDIGRELTNGQIEANPYHKSITDTACNFCEMREACHFDEVMGDKTRYLFTTKMEDC